jgi:hypothetical protein
MKLRAVKIEKKFIPEWNNNKSLPTNEQVVIHFSRIPGASERATYRGFRMSSNGMIEFAFNDNLMCSAFISKIDNLEIDDGEKIKNGGDLATSSHPALAELFTEIRAYLFPDDEDLQPGESKA